MLGDSRSPPVPRGLNAAGYSAQYAGTVYGKGSPIPVNPADTEHGVDTNPGGPFGAGAADGRREVEQRRGLREMIEVEP